MSTGVQSLPMVFDQNHHAATLRRKLCRALELGPKYYFWDLPRYFLHRRRHQLPVWDMGAVINPLREFRVRPSAPNIIPNYYEGLQCLADAGVELTIPQQRLESLLQLWWTCRGVPGDVIECGAYRGATSLLLAVLGRLNRVQQKVLILDTFEGMPAVSACDLGRNSGEFHPEGDQVDVLCRQATALQVMDRIDIHKGLFKDTFRGLESLQSRFSFVHIDANIYTGTREACQFTIPRVTLGGVVVFDDYNGVCDLGARLAIDEYLAGTSHKPTPLTASSAWIRV